MEQLTPQKAVTLLRFLYPIWAVVGMFSIMYVPSTLIVADDAAKTAANIIQNEFLFRMGIVSSLATQLLFILTAIVLYRLFETVHKNQARLMVILALVSVPITMLSTLNSVAALLVLEGSEYLKVFDIEQLRALAMLFLNLDKEGMMIATIFWGLWLFPLGMLVNKSGYFPKIFGMVLMLAGSGYLLDSVTHFILPNYTLYEPILSVIVGVLTLGEVAFMLWVLFKGAKLPK